MGVCGKYWGGRGVEEGGGLVLIGWVMPMCHACETLSLF